MDKTTTTNIHDLNTDIFFIVLQYLGYYLHNGNELAGRSFFADLRLASKALQDVVDQYLACHSRVDLTKLLPKSNVLSFLETVALCRPVALSISHLTIIVDLKHRTIWDIDRKAREQIRHALQYNDKNAEFYIGSITDTNDVADYYLIILLMCRNVKTLHLTITPRNQALDWNTTSPNLPFQQWPNAALERVKITWPATRGTDYTVHDLQDIWLLFSAPSLVSLEINGIAQQNNLYTGNADRAFLRTTYWPVELEIPSLYHHAYNHECTALRYSHHGRPAILPGPPSRLPITHGFKHLTTLVLECKKLEATWLPSILGCFDVLQHLTLEMPMDVGMNASSGLMDIRLLSVALDKLSETLQTLYLHFTLLDSPSLEEYIAALHMGYMGLSALGKLQELKEAALPWYTLLSGVLKTPLVDTAIHSRLTSIPERLDVLTISQCQLAMPETLFTLLEAFIALKKTQGDNCALNAIRLRSQASDIADSEALEKLFQEASSHGLEISL